MIEGKQMGRGNGCRTFLQELGGRAVRIDPDELEEEWEKKKQAEEREEDLADPKQQEKPLIHPPGGGTS
jgi:hypothetical protein